MVCCPVLPNPVQIFTPTYAWTLTTLIGLLSYGPCAHHTGWKQRKRGWNIVSLLVMLAALIVAETVFAVTQGKIIQSMYIEHRGYPGGPWQYFLDTQDSPLSVLMYASLFVLTFLGDLLVIRVIVKCRLHIVIPLRTSQL